MRQLESFDTATACAPRGRVALLSAAIAFALASGLDPAAAEAQPAGAASRATGLEEIIVTARKRDEDIQTVPQSIDVLGGGELASLGKVTFKDLQFEVPGFYIENYESRATIAMRGVGSQVPGRGEAIATHMNGIFQASTATSLSWLFDVERVEVLKGPQGTLYGRNSTGGAVNIISRRPGEEFDGGVKLEYGNDQTVRASVGVDVPLSADWSMRLAGMATRADGRLTNVATGDEIDGNEYTGGRITLVGDAGPVEVEFFGQISKETGGVGELIPLDADYEPRYDWDETYLDLPTKPEGQRDYKIAGLTLSGDLGGGYSWRSVTGYQDYDEPESLLDVNPVPPPAPKVTIAFPQYAEQWSQELQLAFESERLNWVAGALYMDSDEGETRRVDILPFLPGALNSATDNTIKTYALFGDLNYNLTGELRLNVGLRYNRDDVQNTFVGSGPFDGQSFDLDSTQTEPTGRIGLDYTTSTGTMYYVSVAKGFKSGFNDVGFDLQGNPEPAEVEPEQLMAYEIGMKSSLPGDIGVFNVAAFYYDYQDMQVSVGGIPLLADGTPDPNGIPFYTTLNAGEAEILGLEATLSVVASDHLKFEANAGFLDTEFKEYESIDDFGAPADYSGNELPRAPELSGNAAVTFDNLAIGGGTAAVRLEYQYRDEVFDNANNLYELQSTGFVNVLLTWDIGEWQVSASGRNLTEEEYFAFFDGRFFAPPGNFRSWLVGVSYNYH